MLSIINGSRGELIKKSSRGWYLPDVAISLYFEIATACLADLAMTHIYFIPHEFDFLY